MKYEALTRKIYDDFYKNNKCKYYSDCSKNMNTECAYHSSCTLRIGDKYEKTTVDNIPVKILFIGQENPNNTTDTIISTSVEDTNPHYLRTLLTLMKILGVANVENIKDSKKELEKYMPLLKHFSFTNYYHCAFKTEEGQRTKIDHNKKQREHCAEILFKEIKEIQPDIIVKQGKFASGEFEEQLKNTFNIEIEECIYNGKKQTGINISAYKYKTQDDRNFYIIYGFHPTSANPNWYKHKDTLFSAIETVKSDLHKNKNGVD